MIPVATISAMREADRLTIEEFSVPSFALMENAATAITEKAVEMLAKSKGRKVAILAGKGNNGGDGIAVARRLHSRGFDPVLYLATDGNDLKGDAKLNYEIWQKIGGRVSRSVTEPELESFDLIIDALLGTGFSGDVAEPLASIIDRANRSGVPILAVDIPSGVNGDTGVVSVSTIWANETVTLGMLKPGLLLPPGRLMAGKVTTSDIGLVRNAAEKVKTNVAVATAKDVWSILPRRLPSAHKGTCGRVYIIAGSPGLTGAAILSASAALRSGAGLVKVGIPRSLSAIFDSQLLEAMSDPLPEEPDGMLSPSGFSRIIEEIDRADAVAFGPGVGLSAGTSDLLGQILSTVPEKPLVIDADGLNLLARKPELLQLLKRGTVLTPHPGEFSRLCGLSIREIEADRINAARKFAEKTGTVLHLKGAPSITVSPDGAVVINSTGNPGMATGGSGDLLTGIIVALLATGVQPFEATWAGSWISGAAGDFAAEETGVVSLVASDIVSYLYKVFKGVPN